jgi:hypothetical protein
MSVPEFGEYRPSDRFRINHPPEHPSPLAPALAEFLQLQALVCLPLLTDIGTVLIVKAPRREIASVQGTIPIEMRHELHACPTAPVIRMLTTLHDRPQSPLRFESFINVVGDEQRATYAALVGQDEIAMLFYDQELRHALSKVVANSGRESIRRLLHEADNLHAAIPTANYDFWAARDLVLARTQL